MGRKNSFKADGNSKVVQYVSFTGWVGQKLKKLLKRDAEAIRLLTDPALPEAQRREEERYWNRQSDVRRLEVGKKPRADSRIWTRRDEKRANFLTGNSGDTIPHSRTSRFLSRISGQGDNGFRLAYSEATENKTINEVGGLLANLRQTYERLIETSRQLTQFDSELNIFHGIHRDLGQCQVKLFPFLPLSKKRSEGTNKGGRKRLYDPAEQKKVRDLLDDFRLKNNRKRLSPDQKYDLVMESEGFDFITNRVDDPTDRDEVVKMIDKYYKQ